MGIPSDIAFGSMVDHLMDEVLIESGIGSEGVGVERGVRHHAVIHDSLHVALPQPGQHMSLHDGMTFPVVAVTSQEPANR